MPVTAEAAGIEHDPCRVCGGSSRFVFELEVIGHPVRYFDCPACGYLQTQQPHWLEQAYSRAINDVDTGILYRNRLNLGRVVMTLCAYGALHGRVVDYAGGYGILVRLLRDAGVDAWWRDKYCENVLARGFEAERLDGALLTAFEVFEHLVDPLQELAAMLEAAPAVLVSTELITSPGPPPRDWWYLGPEHGQHIGFFRPATLAWMARRLQCDHLSDGVSLHLFSRQPAPRSWPWLQRLRRLSPLVCRARLRSKTMDDFALLRGR